MGARRYAREDQRRRDEQRRAADGDHAATEITALRDTNVELVEQLGLHRDAAQRFRADLSTLLGHQDGEGAWGSGEIYQEVATIAVARDTARNERDDARYQLLEAAETERALRAEVERLRSVLPQQEWVVQLPDDAYVRICHDVPNGWAKTVSGARLKAALEDQAPGEPTGEE